jgi:hypothetical protein
MIPHRSKVWLPVLGSDEVRERLYRVNEQAARLSQCRGELTPEDQAELSNLSIRRNLLEAVLRGREAEKGRKIVSLEQWRFGFVPRRTARRLASLLSDRRGRRQQ